MVVSKGIHGALWADDQTDILDQFCLLPVALTHERITLIATSVASSCELSV